MPVSISARQIVDVISVVCDAVQQLVEDDVSGAVRRLEEAAGGLHARITNRSTEGDGLGHALRAVKTLAHALEAIAAENFDVAEVNIRSAVDAISSAVHRLDTPARDERDSRESAVQFSVSEAIRIPNEDAIRDILRNLATRPAPEAFVIILDADTGRFVQFSGSHGKPLTLEIPIGASSEHEIAHSTEVIEARGFESTRRDESISVSIGHDVGGGARLAMDIFREVFRSQEDFSLKIEEN